jgi:SAM-dependent methyltransferase
MLTSKSRSRAAHRQYAIATPPTGSDDCGVPLPSLTSAGGAARRAVLAVPRELVRRGLPVASRVSRLGPPDLHLAVERYARIAGSYDRRTACGSSYRDSAVEALAPQPGETVLDVGCGTGLNFALVEEGIGPRGRLIGIDPSAEMLDLARVRVEENGWRNVVLVNAAAEDADPPPADAALLCGVHDVMRSPGALANIVAHVRPGGRIVAGGAKWAPWWRPGAMALNLSTLSLNRDCVTTFEGFDRPWDRLAPLVADLEVEEVWFGGGYIARATRRPTVAAGPG